MPVFNNVLAGAAGSGGGADAYKIERSLRFNDNDSAYLSRTFSGGNRKTWTWSAWVKKSSNSAETPLFIAKGNGGPNPHNGIWFGSDRLNLNSYPYNFTLTVERLLKDTSAWYHFVVAWDTTQSTASDRIKIWVNGERQDQFNGTVSYPNQDFEGIINDNGYLNQIGQWDSGYNRFFDGYMAEVHFIDGEALDETDFGAFDSNGVWNPIEFTGSHNVGNGVNGFYLDFSDNTSTTTLGNDAAGSNNWTLNNFSAAETDVTHWRQASGADNPSSGTVGNITYKSQIAITNPQSGSLVWDHQNTQIIGLQNITGVTSLRLLISSRGGAKLGINTASMFSFGNHGGDYSNAQSQAAWYTVSNPPSTLTSIAATGGGGGTGNFLSVWGIEVNGNRVVDTSGADCDSLIDSPTNYEADSGNNGGNYAVLNPLSQRTGTISNGNLRFVASPDSSRNESTIAVTSGKYYWEAKAVSNMQTHTIGGRIGICQSNTISITSAEQVEFDVDWHADSGVRVRRAGQSSVSVGSGTNYNDGDLIGVALDADNNIVKFYKNGTLAYTIDFSQYITPGSVPLVAHSWGYFSSTWDYNFGQRPFSQTVPTGYKSLCTQNLPNPTIANPSTAFDIATYTGTGAAKTISLQMSPDLVWTKERGGTQWHYLIDTLRGNTKALFSNANNAEYTTNAQVLTAFNSDGYSIGTDSAVNAANTGFVSWNWDAGSSNTTISAGGLNSSVYNDGEVWSTTGTLSVDLNGSTVSNMTGPLTKAFNGSTANSEQVTEGSSYSSGTKTYTYTFGTAQTNVTSARVYCYKGNSAEGGTVSFGNGTVNKPADSAYGWIDATSTIPSNGTISALTFTTTATSSIGSARNGFHAIELNGKILLDNGVTPVDNFPSIASTVRANPTAGFSIVNWVGTGTGSDTVAHGLNSEPKIVIVKNRTNAVGWTVYHTLVDGSLDYMYLNINDANANSSWNKPTSNVFSSSGGSVNNTNVLAYCFSPVAGYSAFGKYTGNGSANGPFINTSMRPAFLLVKSTTLSQPWYIFDSARNTYNSLTNYLKASSSDQEGSASQPAYFHFMSNGFQVTDTNVAFNQSGQSYLYITFAENPFKLARAR